MQPPAPTTKRDLSVSMEQANVYALLTGGLPAAIFPVAFALIWGLERTAEAFSAPLRLPGYSLAALVLFLAGVVVHELIHGATWKLAGRKPWSAIRFGLDKRTFSPYAHCSESLPAGAYRLGTLLPGVITGFGPALVGLATGSLWVTLAGAFFVLAAGGDLLVLWVIRGLPASAMVEDHPTRAGCYVLE